MQRKLEEYSEAAGKKYADAVSEIDRANPLGLKEASENIIKRMDEPLDGLVMDKAKQAEISSQVDAELRDKFKKAGITGYYEGEKLDNVTTVNSIRENLSEFLNRPTATTKEYKEKLEKDGSFITRGLLGLSGSK
jgi:hypothetical protein